MNENGKVRALDEAVSSFLAAGEGELICLSFTPDGTGAEAKLPGITQLFRRRAGFPSQAVWLPSLSL